MRYKILIAYDGTSYHGWQQQQDLPTIAGILQNSFLQVFGKAIKILGTSRTDAGVHALGQVATFDVEQFVDKSKMLYAWNNVLPPEIYIRGIEHVDSDFNVFAAQEKIYHYHFFLERPLPFSARFGWYYFKKPSLQKLEQALAVFLGTHDFRAFSTGDDRGDDTIRTINAIDLMHFKRFNMYRITVKGPKFLHHMVRRIVGASLDVASHNHLSVSYVTDTLAQRMPSSLLSVAPARGLVLYKVSYKN